MKVKWLVYPATVHDWDELVSSMISLDVFVKEYRSMHCVEIEATSAQIAVINKLTCVGLAETYPV